MEGISDIKIIGIDETRPPMIRKEPYINLYFKLSHKAPKDWCDAFNHSVARWKHPVKIDPAKGLVVETWVRKPEEIEEQLENIKQAIRRCNEEYIALIQAAARASAGQGSTADDTGEQGRLNRIIAGLNFDDG